MNIHCIIHVIDCRQGNQQLISQESFVDVVFPPSFFKLLGEQVTEPLQQLWILGQFCKHGREHCPVPHFIGDSLQVQRSFGWWHELWDSIRCYICRHWMWFKHHPVIKAGTYQQWNTALVMDHAPPSRSHVAAWCLVSIINVSSFFCDWHKYTDCYLLPWMSPVCPA